MAPLHTFVQLSDLHLDASAQLYGCVDTVARFAAALEVVLAMAEPPEALLLSGDLANDATPDDYRAVRALVDPVLERLGVPLVVVPGNHDDVPALREHLLGDTTTTGPMDSATDLGGLRLVALDSAVTGHGHGELADEQLSWLADVLATPAEQGTVLTLHHPPVPSPVTLFEHLALAAPERLAAVLRGTDVRMILCGHAHHVSCGSLAGIPVWIAPPVAYGSDATAPTSLYRGMSGGCGLTRVDVFPDTVLATLIPLDGRAPVCELAVDDIVAEL